MMMRMIPVLDALDADDDGVLSKSEIENATAALNKLDKNEDGQLAGEELRPDFPGRGGPGEGFGGGRGFGPPDGRGPGGRGPFAGRGGEDRLSADQVTRSLRAAVMKADTDGDGFLTGRELLGALRQGNDAEATQRDRPGPPRDGDRSGPPRGPGFGGRPDGDPRAFFGRMFQMRDQNQDGVLKGDEIPEQMAGRLEQIDSDGDGAVSREEMERMVGRMRAGGRGPGRGPRDAAEGGRRPGGDLPRRPEAEE